MIRPVYGGEYQWLDSGRIRIAARPQYVLIGLDIENFSDELHVHAKFHRADQNAFQDQRELTPTQSSP